MVMGNEAKRRRSPVAPTLQSLPADILCNIAMHLDLQERRVVHSTVSYCHHGTFLGMAMQT